MTLRTHPARRAAVPPIDRLMPYDDAAELMTLVGEIADTELAPRADAAEAAEEFPRELIKLLGRTGLLGLPYPAGLGGAEQPFEVYLQVLEELAARWATVALTVSVHSLSCWALVNHGTDGQRKEWLPDMLGGDLLGAYCLSEAQAGSDAAALSTRAVRDGDEYVLTGSKSWISHATWADFLTVFARTSDDGARGVSCFLVPADTDGLSFGVPEKKMGLNASPTTQVRSEEHTSELQSRGHLVCRHLLEKKTLVALVRSV